MKQSCPTCGHTLELSNNAAAYEIGDLVTVRIDLTQTVPAIPAGTLGTVAGYGTAGNRVLVNIPLPLLSFFNRTWTRTDGHPVLPMLFNPNEIKPTESIK